MRTRKLIKYIMVHFKIKIAVAGKITGSIILLVTCMTKCSKIFMITFIRFRYNNSHNTISFR